MRGMRKHHAIEFHDIGIELPDPFDVRMAGAEVIERDQEAVLAELLHGLREPFQVFRALFEHFEHDAPRSIIQPPQIREQRGRVIRIGQRAGMHVQKQPLVLARRAP